MSTGTRDAPSIENEPIDILEIARERYLTTINHRWRLMRFPPCMVSARTMKLAEISFDEADDDFCAARALCSQLQRLA